MGSLSLRPGDSLTIPWMALSVGFIRFVSSTDATQATRLLTLALVGLAPTEHASLRWTHSLPKTQFDHKERLIHRGVKGSKICRAVAGSIFDGRANSGRALFPSGPESSRISADSRSGDTPLQCESNSPSRPPFVAMMQSADFLQFNDRLTPGIVP